MSNDNSTVLISQMTDAQGHIRIHLLSSLYNNMHSFATQGHSAETAAMLVGPEVIFAFNSKTKLTQ